MNSLTFTYWGSWIKKISEKDHTNIPWTKIILHISESLQFNVEEARFIWRNFVWFQARHACLEERPICFETCRNWRVGVSSCGSYTDSTSAMLRGKPLQVSAEGRAENSMSNPGPQMESRGVLARRWRTYRVHASIPWGRTVLHRRSGLSAVERSRVGTRRRLPDLLLG